MEEKDKTCPGVREHDSEKHSRRIPCNDLRLLGKLRKEAKSFHSSTPMGRTGVASSDHCLPLSLTDASECQVADSGDDAGWPPGVPAKWRTHGGAAGFHHSEVPRWQREGSHNNQCLCSRYVRVRCSHETYAQCPLELTAVQSCDTAVIRALLPPRPCLTFHTVYSLCV